MNQTPPRTTPSVILKEKEAYQAWLVLHRNFPRVERLGIGQKIEDVFLDVLELSFACVYMSPEQKVIVLGKVISKLDTLKFFMQLAWESKLIPQAKYIELSQKLEEIGKMLGGWRKGLQSPSAQTSQNKTLIMS
jgi:hypothetical protein